MWGHGLAVALAVQEEWLDLMVSEVVFSLNISLILSQGLDSHWGLMELYQHIWMENLDLAFSLCIHAFVDFCISAFHSVLPLPHFSPSLSFCCLQCFSLSLFSPEIFLPILFDTRFSFIPFLFASLHISMLLLLSTKTWTWSCWGEMMPWT